MLNISSLHTWTVISLVLEIIVKLLKLSPNLLRRKIFLKFFFAIWRNVPHLIQRGVGQRWRHMQQQQLYVAHCSAAHCPLMCGRETFAMLNRMRKHGILVFTWAKAMTGSICTNTSQGNKPANPSKLDKYCSGLGGTNYGLTEGDPPILQGNHLLIRNANKKPIPCSIIDFKFFSSSKIDRDKLYNMIWPS